MLDVGCGEGLVLAELKARGAGEIHGVDIVDLRGDRDIPFQLYDGVALPFPDRRFDLVLLSFVLHHVPDERKLPLLREALRVSRGKVFIVEDTPSSPIDRVFSHRHGEAYRRKIGAAPHSGSSPRPNGAGCSAAWASNPRRVRCPGSAARSCSRSPARCSCCASRYSRRDPAKFRQLGVRDLTAAFT